MPLASDDARRSPRRRAMTGEPFANRVQALRSSWIERRHVKTLAGAHDYMSQYRLLLTLREWAVQAARDIRAVYGPEPSVVISPEPGRSDPGAGWRVTVDGQHTLAFELSERRRGGVARWSLSASISSAGADGAALVATGPERRTGQWTRGRLEDLLLALLGAYERSAAGAAAQSLPGAQSQTAG